MLSQRLNTVVRLWTYLLPGDKMKRFKQYRMDEAANKALSRVWHHAKTRNIGIISADRGEHKPSERRNNRNLLKADIRQAGFGYIHARGRFIENLGTKEERPVDEHSFIVIGNDQDSGNLKGFLKKMGKKYQQDSVIHKPYGSEDAFMIDTKGNNDMVNLGKFHPNKMSMYQTKMKGPRTFTYDETETGRTNRLLKGPTEEKLWEYFSSFGFFSRPTQTEIDQDAPGKKIPYEEVLSILEGKKKNETI